MIYYDEKLFHIGQLMGDKQKSNGDDKYHNESHLDRNEHTDDSKNDVTRGKKILCH